MTSTEQLSNGERILLVEDDADDAFMFRRVLGKAGHGENLVHLRDGEEAIHYFKETEDGSKIRPTVVFLDLKMPKMDGFEVLSWLGKHEELAGLPVVVLSGSIREADKQKATSLGAKAYREKPLDREELTKILAEFGL
jgi:two-component system response regulator